jgi:hypothetical protein
MKNHLTWSEKKIPFAKTTTVPFGARTRASSAAASRVRHYATVWFFDLFLEKCVVKDKAGKPFFGVPAPHRAPMKLAFLAHPHHVRCLGKLRNRF